MWAAHLHGAVGGRLASRLGPTGYLAGELPAEIPRALLEMVELITRLIERDHAYESGGDVYFDVHSYADYGALSGQRPGDLQPGADSELETVTGNWFVCDVMVTFFATRNRTASNAPA